MKWSQQHARMACAAFHVLFVVMIVVSPGCVSRNDEPEIIVCDPNYDRYRCDGESEEIVTLTEDKALEIELRQREGSLLIDLAFCIDRSKENEISGTYKSNRKKIVRITREVLSAYSKSDLFSTENMDDMDVDIGKAHKEFLEKKKNMKQELYNAYRQSGIPFIEKVYFASFLVK